MNPQLSVKLYAVHIQQRTLLQLRRIEKRVWITISSDTCVVNVLVIVYVKFPIHEHSYHIGAYIQKSGRKRKRECTYDEILGEIRMDWSKKYSEYCAFF